jgi:hypothetical protein
MTKQRSTHREGCFAGIEMQGWCPVLHPSRLPHSSTHKLNPFLGVIFIHNSAVPVNKVFNIQAAFQSFKIFFFIKIGGSAFMLPVVLQWCSNALNSAHNLPGLYIFHAYFVQL